MADSFDVYSQFTIVIRIAVGSVPHARNVSIQRTWQRFGYDLSFDAALVGDKQSGFDCSIRTLARPTF